MLTFRREQVSPVANEEVDGVLARVDGARDQPPQALVALARLLHQTHRAHAQLERHLEERKWGLLVVAIEMVTNFAMEMSLFLKRHKYLGMNFKVSLSVYTRA